LLWDAVIRSQKAKDNPRLQKKKKGMAKGFNRCENDISTLLTAITRTVLGIGQGSKPQRSRGEAAQTENAQDPLATLKVI